MANENGEYISRFERMEKTIEAIVEVQTMQGRNLEKIVSAQQQQADNFSNLSAKVGELVGAIRSLIDHIPPQNLR